MAADTHRGDADIPEVTLVFEDDDLEEAGRRSTGTSPRSHRHRRMSRHDPAQGLGHRLPESGVPTGILAGALVAISVLGIVLVNAAGLVTLTGVTTTLGLGSAILPQWLASTGSALFGTLGATLIAVAVFAALMVRSRRGLGQAFIVTMGAAWVLTGLVSTVTIGATPYLFTPLAFVAALSCALTLITPARLRPLAALAGTLATAAFGTSVAYVGTTTAVGVVASVLVGVIGVAVGAVVWNRWRAPVLEARERMAAAMAGAWGPGPSRP